MKWSHDAVFIYCIVVFRRVGVLGARDPNLRCIFVKDCSVFEAFNTIVQYIEPYCLFAEKYQFAASGDKALCGFMRHDWSQEGITMKHIWTSRRNSKIYYTPNFEEAMSKTNTKAVLGGNGDIVNVLALAKGFDVESVWPFNKK